MSEANQSAAAEAPLRLLLVEDSKFDAKLIQTYLRSADAPRGLEISHASRLQDGVDHLKAHHCDCVLLDLGLPDGEGVDNIEAILGAAPDVAIVVLTGLKNDKVATSALQQGAQDYICLLYTSQS
ncbi:response regulator [bacterium]|nr:response regulator [bacterium]